MNNPMARMVLPKKEEKVEEPKLNPPLVTEPEQKAEGDPDAPVDTPDATPPKNPMRHGPVELSDVDMENYYLTGILEYSYKLKGKIPVKLRVLSPDEILATNDFLYKSTSGKEDSSVANVMLQHSIKVLAYALLQFGTRNLGSMKPEAREEFINKELPGIMIPILFKKYGDFEYTANKLLQDPDYSKN